VRLRPRVFAFLSAPVDMLALSPSSLTRSLFNSNIGAKGASVLAAILKETQIIKLECAAAPECSHFCQHPLTACLSPWQCRRPRTSDRRAQGH